MDTSVNGKRHMPVEFQGNGESGYARNAHPSSLRVSVVHSRELGGLASIPERKVYAPEGDGVSVGFTAIQYVVVLDDESVAASKGAHPEALPASMQCYKSRISEMDTKKLRYQLKYIYQSIAKQTKHAGNNRGSSIQRLFEKLSFYRNKLPIVKDVLKLMRQKVGSIEEGDSGGLSALCRKVGGALKILDKEIGLLAWEYKAALMGEMSSARARIAQVGCLR